MRLAASSSPERLRHLDGLRGLAASVVVLTHFVSAVLPHGVFGGVTMQHGGWEKVFLYPPLGLLVAGHAAVCLFFILSGFVLTLPLLLKSASWREIVAATIKRPFRLVGIVLVTTCLSWLLWKHGFYHNHELSRVTGSWWIDTYWSGPAPALGEVTRQLVTSPFDMATTYNLPMWTIKRELLGSFLVYAILLVGRSRLVRWGIILGGLWWFAGSLFQCFIFGLLFADLECARQRRAGEGMAARPLPSWLSAMLIFITMVCGAYPRYAASISEASHQTYWFSPPLRLLGGGWSMVGAGALFILALYAPGARRVLTWRPVLFLGDVSYSFYGVHFLLVGSFFSWVFITVEPVCGYAGAAVLSFLFLVLTTLLCAKVLHETVDTFSTRVARAVGAKVLRLLSWGRPKTGPGQE